MKEEKLFKEVPVLKAVLKLALPTVMGQIILVIYNMADTFFVGLTNSDAMLTAVTICMPAFMFLSAISNLFGVGGSSLIARSLGINEKDKAKSASSFAVWGCLFLTLIYSFGTYLLANAFINALGGSNPEVHMHALSYIKVTVIFGGVFTSMNVLLGHLVRAEGRAVDASFGVALGGILNIALDPLFMFVLLPKGQEVFGAALATCLSNALALLYFLVLIFFRYRKNTYIRVRFDRRIISESIPKSVISVGLPACIMTLFENISYAVLDGLMAFNGVMMQAGLGVAKKINMLAHNSVRGIAQGVLPLLAYNYSARNFKRMKKAISITMMMTVGVATLCLIVNFIFADQLVDIFIHTQSVSNFYADRFLKILTIGAPFSACAYTFISFFQAVGKGGLSFMLAILRKGLVDIPMMYLLARQIPIYGEVMATPITDIICCVMSILVFVKFIRKLEKEIPEEEIINIPESFNIYDTVSDVMNVIKDDKKK